MPARGFSTSLFPWRLPREAPGMPRGSRTFGERGRPLSQKHGLAFNRQSVAVVTYCFYLIRSISSDLFFFFPLPNQGVRIWGEHGLFPAVHQSLAQGRALETTVGSGCCPQLVLQ